MSVALQAGRSGWACSVQWDDPGAVWGGGKTGDLGMRTVVLSLALTPLRPQDAGPWLDVDRAILSPWVRDMRFNPVVI